MRLTIKSQPHSIFTIFRSECFPVSTYPLASARRQGGPLERHRAEERRLEFQEKPSQLLLCQDPDKQQSIPHPIREPQQQEAYSELQQNSPATNKDSHCLPSMLSRRILRWRESPESTSWHKEDSQTACPGSLCQKQLRISKADSLQLREQPSPLSA